MRTVLFLMAFLAVAPRAVAVEKPVIYNYVDGESTPLDAEIHAAYEARFQIEDVGKAADYVQPKPTNGKLPRVAKNPEGKSLGGHVLVAYVITAEGKSVDAVVLETSDPLLNETAIKAITKLQFKPAILKGVAVGSLAAQDFNFEATPTEFVTQILEPTGGKILRPKGWFYTEGSDKHSYSWIMSREEATKKPYTTGVRIQAILGVKEGTGKAPKEFILEYVAGKKKKADKIIRSCDPQDQGMFTRICLETEEGPFHILYSLFWGNEMDLVVVSIAGTTPELWSTYAPAFDKMNAFELIDMKRFEKSK